ncbi:MAG: hypothetical protein ACFB13_19215 [Kiloniellaceae bacterium]
MTWRALAFAVVVTLLPLPLCAQASGQTSGTSGGTSPGTSAPSAVETNDGSQADPAAVLAAFTRLVDRGEARLLFGLPETLFWRRTGELAVALLADDAEALRPLYLGAAAPFAAASGLPITLIESGPLPPPGTAAAELVPAADLVVVVGPRGRLVDLAEAANVNKGMLARFEIGTWPFMFVFQADNLRRGVVLLADDEPERAREASFILATVWGLGGVTLGPELTGLVGDADEGVSLTPLGSAVFRLFFHPDLDVGMPLADAVQRAGTLLPR